MTGAALALGFGLLSAFANAIAGILSRDLALRMPARQLIGPLFALNALVVLPLAPFVEWHWSPTIALYHVVSVLLLILTSLSVWDLFAHGAASATVTAQSISPLPAMLAVALTIPDALEPVQVVGAVCVVLGVLGALSNAFAGLGRTRTIVTVLVAAAGTGLVTVMGGLLAREGAGIVETYLVRTSVAAGVFLLAIPPRQIPVRQLPRLGLRAVVISTHFLLILVGVQYDDPGVVQTGVATAPLFVLAIEAMTSGRRPRRRETAAAGIAAIGVAAILLT